MNLTGLQREWTLRRTAVVVASATVMAGFAGCSENVDGTAGCPTVCTDVSSQIQTVTLDAVTTDTTVPANLGIGSESLMLLASRGDTLDTRVIVRFDTLPSQTQIRAGSDTLVPITTVDSVYLKLQFDSLGAANTDSVTLTVYDVDTTAGNDTAVAVLAPLFSLARRITSQSYAPGKLVDTTRIKLPNALMLSKIQGGKPLRIGLRITASHSHSVSARLLSSATIGGPQLTLRVSADTAIRDTTISPHSKTPMGDKIVAGNLSDFTLVVNGMPPPPATTLAIGGVPASRAYLRFNVPLRILDSSIVVRATLLLTQLPSASPGLADSMLVQPRVVVAGAAVTDPARAAQIISSTLVGTEPLVTFPHGSGVKEVEVAPLFRVWALQAEAAFPRALVLQSGQEGLSPQQALFYSSRAPDTTVHPKLRISYTLRARIGTP